MGEQRPITHEDCERIRKACQEGRQGAAEKKFRRRLAMVSIIAAVLTGVTVWGIHIAIASATHTESLAEGKRKDQEHDDKIVSLQLQVAKLPEQMRVVIREELDRDKARK